MDFFTWVGDLSPWIWLALGIVLITLEILAPSFIVIWPGLAAIVMALLTWLVPDLSGEVLIAIFAVLSLVSIFVGRKFARDFTDQEPANRLNSRSKNLVGRRGKVLSFDAGSGKVEIDGVQWPAVWPDGEITTAGHQITVTAADGVNLTVQNL